ncbi:MAG: hypothetical protein C4547_13360 [Phycisphaerales bacterium]|nr:MAG: hypothetical protein C4547_13360 [Phycisphaerales bacterium]
MNIDPTTPGVAPSPDPRQAAKLRELEQTTGQVVGRLFFGAILAQARSTGLKGEYGHGGRGEDVFGAQLDGLFAERVGQAGDFGPAKALYEHLADQQRRVVRYERSVQEIYA